jgi:acetate kinase
MKVLVLNSGSSSLKFQLISTDPDRITKSNDERDASGMAGVRAATDMHAVGHRAVQGGELFADSRFGADEVLKGIEDWLDVAPFHNPTTSGEFSRRGKYPVLTRNPRPRL